MRSHLLVGECWVWDIMRPDVCLCFLLSWVGQPALSDSKPSVECLVFKSRKSICDKVFVRNKLFYFYIWQSRKMRHKMKSWVVEKKRYTTRLQNIHSTWTLKAFFFTKEHKEKSLFSRNSFICRFNLFYTPRNCYGTNLGAKCFY